MAGDLKLKPARLLNRKTLEEYASWLAGRIVQLADEQLNLPKDELSVRVVISEEWPYVVEAEVYVKSRYKVKGMERALTEILDRAIAELAKKAVEEGFAFSQ